MTKKKADAELKNAPARMGRLSMDGVDVADALRAAMQVPVPPAKPRVRKKAAKKAPKKP